MALSDRNDGSDLNEMRKRIRESWNAGLTLSQTFKRLSERCGFTNKGFLISEWREMKRKFGCSCVPFYYLIGRNHPLPPIQPSQAELDAWVSPLCGSYANWKGISGPGKMLRELCEK